MSPGLEPTRCGSHTLLTIPHPWVSVVTSTASAGWDGVRALIVDCQPVDGYAHSSPLQLVAFNLGGTTRVEWRRGGRLTRYESEPGSLTVIPAGDDHRFRTDGKTRALVWMIDPAHLHAIAEREWGMPRVEILEACNVRDADFRALGRRLANRMLSPFPGSRLCAEALNTELTLHFLWNYSTLPRRDEERAEQPSDPGLRSGINDNGAGAKAGTYSPLDRQP
jgi:hypothetical protein